jgi:hypothetical protein
LISVSGTNVYKIRNGEERDRQARTITPALDSRYRRCERRQAQRDPLGCRGETGQLLLRRGRYVLGTGFADGISESIKSGRRIASFRATSGAASRKRRDRAIDSMLYTSYNDTVVVNMEH